MHRRTLLSLGSSALFSGLLGACGFRLRGSVRMPNYPLLVRGETDATTLALIARLREGGVAVWLSGDPKAPDTIDHVLVVHQDRRQRVVQGSNSSGLVRELLLKVQFRWSLVNAKDEELIAPQELIEEQDMSYNETAALGKSEEEAALFESMQSRVVQTTIARLSRVTP